MILPILLYHHVVKDSKNSDLAPFIIDETDFIWQLNVLEDLGFTAITLKELMNTHDFNKKVILTFDDCPHNLMDFAIPHLEKKKWQSVHFAPYNHLGGYNEWNVRKGKTKIPLMTMEEVKMISDLGHEIGAHSMTHPHLNQCSQANAIYEITESKKQIEAFLGKPVEAFAYPYGHYPKNYKIIMEDAGYSCAVSMYSTSFSVLDDPYCIRRTVIEQGETLQSFKKKLSKPYQYSRIMSDYFTLRKEGLR
jgi:peptidoglycan/xylan/chitin deacetylase (PgdA/CDA1 family)